MLRISKLESAEEEVFGTAVQNRTGAEPSGPTNRRIDARAVPRA
jgi:hypothetical protein